MRNEEKQIYCRTIFDSITFGFGIALLIGIPLFLAVDFDMEVLKPALEILQKEGIVEMLKFVFSNPDRIFLLMFVVSVFVFPLLLAKKILRGRKDG